MATLDSRLWALRRKAAKDDVLPEHLIAFAKLGDPRAIPVILELSTEYRWSRSIHDDAGRHVGPMARWAEVVCTYLDGGCDALVDYARRAEDESFHFAVSLLGDVKAPESAFALADLTNDLLRAFPERVHDACELADAINLTLSFKNPPPVTQAAEETLRSFLHALLRLDLSEPQRARAVCALRGVGDVESIAQIAELAEFTGPWSEAASMATEAIRRRLRRR
jgi:HEAT repeat protein